MLDCAGARSRNASRISRQGRVETLPSIPIVVGDDCSVEVTLAPFVANGLMKGCGGGGDYGRRFI